MQVEEYRQFMRRADEATTIRDLRAVADEVKAAHPGDLEAELIESTCLTYATAMIEYMAQRPPVEQNRPAAARSPRGEPSGRPARRDAAVALGRELAFRAPAADKQKPAMID